MDTFSNNNSNTTYCFSNTKGHNTVIQSKALDAEMKSQQSCNEKNPTQPWTIED